MQELKGGVFRNRKVDWQRWQGANFCKCKSSKTELFKSEKLTGKDGKAPVFANAKTQVVISQMGNQIAKASGVDTATVQRAVKSEFANAISGIAKASGVGRGTVERALSKPTFPNGKVQVITGKDGKAHWKQMRQDGMTLEAIAKVSGAGINTVKRGLDSQPTLPNGKVQGKDGKAPVLPNGKTRSVIGKYGASLRKRN